MTDPRRGTLAVAVLVVVLAGTGVALGSSTAAGPGDDAGIAVAQQVETDLTQLRVSVAPDGDAQWTVEYYTRLDDENTTAAFESLQADIEANPSNYTDRFAERIRSTVRSAENATGRSMTVDNVSVTAEKRSLGEFGVVSYTFDWSNFAQVQAGGDRLVVGDAVEGFFLDRRTRLTFAWPESYSQVSVDPQPDISGDRVVGWKGNQTDFVSGQPSLVVARQGAGTTTTGTGGTTSPGGDGTTGDTTEGPGGGEAGGGSPPMLLLFALGALVVGALGVAWYRRRTLDGGAGTVVDGGGDEPPSGADGSDAGDAASAGAASQSDESEPAPETTPPVDEELLSNEERVLKLLRDRGGRIKQQEIVEALDWTEAKTSQVVSGMREEGTIDGFRLGRENVLTLPEVDEAASVDQGDEDGDTAGEDRTDWGDRE